MISTKALKNLLMTLKNSIMHLDNESLLLKESTGIINGLKKQITLNLDSESLQRSHSTLPKKLSSQLITNLTMNLFVSNTFVLMAISKLESKRIEIIIGTSTQSIIDLEKLRNKK